MPLAINGAAGFPSSLSVTTNPFTVPAGLIDRWLVVAVAAGIDSSNGIVSVSYDGAPLTLAKSLWNGGAGVLRLWTLQNPPEGAHDLVVTLSAATASRAVAFVVSGAGAITAGIGRYEDAATVSTLVNDTTPDQWIIDGIFVRSSVAIVNVDPGQTLIGTIGKSGVVNLGVSLKQGAPGQTSTWTMDTRDIAHCSIIVAESNPVTATKIAITTQPEAAVDVGGTITIVGAAEDDAGSIQTDYVSSGNWELLASQAPTGWDLSTVVDSDVPAGGVAALTFDVPMAGTWKFYIRDASASLVDSGDSTDVVATLRTGGTEAPPPPPPGSVRLAATPRDVFSNPLTGRIVTWASSNEAVATVDDTGLVTAVAAGSCNITATCEGVTSPACSVTVTEQ